MELQKCELRFRLITHLLRAVSPVDLGIIVCYSLPCGHLILLEFGPTSTNSVLC